ncbi:hypothetical protein BDM02DRAFT_2900804 [Thelephora ganbajun]|uniref:Uncharacterized protein n=1 Tax=Thelephora ganbajun TaxID=370292 RepID=A0ACB6ZRQ9_THEGA|nr:hypothetical protein BDM02DRAFT_2900804 [Thelephora ganbajun]
MSILHVFDLTGCSLPVVGLASVGGISWSCASQDIQNVVCEHSRWCVLKCSLGHRSCAGPVDCVGKLLAILGKRSTQRLRSSHAEGIVFQKFAWRLSAFSRVSMLGLRPRTGMGERGRVIGVTSSCSRMANY